jgi:hypothetical protein
MRIRLAAVLLTLGIVGLVFWKAELFTVSRPGAGAVPLARVTVEREAAGFEVALPRVPVGVVRVTAGSGAWLVHYWAPWERHGRSQVLALDSLARSLGHAGPHVAVVCFDPFPSVARFAARLRLGVPILLDHRRELQAVLPCPSIPYTWLLDARGRVLAAQPGEVDWLAPATRALLLEAAGSGAPRDSATAASAAAAASAPSAADQARAVWARGRTNQRSHAARPPNKAAL